MDNTMVTPEEVLYLLAIAAYINAANIGYEKLLSLDPSLVVVKSSQSPDIKQAEAEADQSAAQVTQEMQTDEVITDQIASIQDSLVGDTAPEELNKP